MNYQQNHLLDLDMSTTALVVLGRIARHLGWEDGTLYDCANRTDGAERYAVEARGWYNGRERGVVLRFGSWTHFKHELLVVVAEHRSSDDIIVDAVERDGHVVDWHTRGGWYEPAWEARKEFGYDRDAEAADHVMQLFERYAKERLVGPGKEAAR